MSGTPSQFRLARGITCPACGGRLELRRAYRQRPGVVVRYRRCVVCKTRMKTRETVLSVSPAK